MNDISGVPYTFRASHSGNHGGSRATSDIRYIVMHYTGNDKDTAKANANYFANNSVGAGAHYFVDDDCIYQSIADNVVAWHCQTPNMALKCGCRNSNSIGIEMCCCGNYDISEKTIDNAVKLAKYLMSKYNISASNVIRHYDVCGKDCPAPLVRNVKRWQALKAKLTAVEVVEKEDDEVVTSGTMTVNGKDIKVDKIIKDGNTFVKIRNLENAGFSVGYDVNSKNITLHNDVKAIDVNDGKCNAVNVDGYNYVKLRNIADVLGKSVEQSGDKIVVK